MKEVKGKELESYKGLSQLYYRKGIIESVPIAGSDFNAFHTGHKNQGKIEYGFDTENLKHILEEYFLVKKYEIVDIKFRVKQKEFDEKKLLNAISLDRSYFYLLSLVFEKLGIVSIKMRKGEDELIVMETGTHSTKHTEELLYITRRGSVGVSFRYSR